jgi:hypothetical protein
VAGESFQKFLVHHHFAQTDQQEEILKTVEPEL